MENNTIPQLRDTLNYKRHKDSFKQLENFFKPLLKGKLLMDNPHSAIVSWLEENNYALDNETIMHIGKKYKLWCSPYGYDESLASEAQSAFSNMFWDDEFRPMSDQYTNDQLLEEFQQAEEALTGPRKDMAITKATLGPPFMWELYLYKREKGIALNTPLNKKQQKEFIETLAEIQGKVSQDKQDYLVSEATNVFTEGQKIFFGHIGRYLDLLHERPEYHNTEINKEQLLKLGQNAQLFNSEILNLIQKPAAHEQRLDPQELEQLQNLATQYQLLIEETKDNESYINLISDEHIRHLTDRVMREVNGSHKISNTAQVYEVLTEEVWAFNKFLIDLDYSVNTTEDSSKGYAFFHLIESVEMLNNKYFQSAQTKLVSELEKLTDFERPIREVDARSREYQVLEADLRDADQDATEQVLIDWIRTAGHGFYLHLDNATCITLLFDYGVNFQEAYQKATGRQQVLDQGDQPPFVAPQATPDGAIDPKTFAKPPRPRSKPEVAPVIVEETPSPLLDSATLAQALEWIRISALLDDYVGIKAEWLLLDEPPGVRDEQERANIQQDAQFYAQNGMVKGHFEAKLASGTVTVAEWEKFQREYVEKIWTYEINDYRMGYCATTRFNESGLLALDDTTTHHINGLVTLITEDIEALHNASDKEKYQTAPEDRVTFDNPRLEELFKAYKVVIEDGEFDQFPAEDYAEMKQLLEKEGEASCAMFRTALEKHAEAGGVSVNQLIEELLPPLPPIQIEAIDVEDITPEKPEDEMKKLV